ncbi:MAG: AbrB/MazE/SpoVT family DNA-binding domain-containing protein [Euryarchaeota archaeon]|nr:AbrB/MazE/SpoVT family DNA-binding domain-containing protein [Euryarchaeota archaeon]
MKLQRVLRLKAYGKDYYKWQVTLPPVLIEKLGWEAGSELEGEVRGKELRIRRKESA